MFPYPQLRLVGRWRQAARELAGYIALVYLRGAPLAVGTLGQWSQLISQGCPKTVWTAFGDLEAAGLVERVHRVGFPLGGELERGGGPAGRRFETCAYRPGQGLIALLADPRRVASAPSVRPPWLYVLRSDGERQDHAVNNRRFRNAPNLQVVSSPVSDNVHSVGNSPTVKAPDLGESVSASPTDSFVATRHQRRQMRLRRREAFFHRLARSEAMAALAPPPKALPGADRTPEAARETVAIRSQFAQDEFSGAPEGQSPTEPPPIAESAEEAHARWDSSADPVLKRYLALVRLME